MGEGMGLNCHYGDDEECSEDEEGGEEGECAILGEVGVGLEAANGVLDFLQRGANGVVPLGSFIG